MISPGDILKQSSVTYEDKIKEYGELWRTAGSTIKTLFPDGITLVSENDFTKFVTIVYCCTKLRRYCHNFESGGHIDSCKDLQVYAAILEAKTREF